jgi:hypothetical protein
VFFALFLGATGRLVPAQPPKAEPSSAVTGQLNIEGQGVERITLERREARHGLDPCVTVVPDRSGAAVLVPAGEYWLREVAIKGGYSCSHPRRIVDGLNGIEQEEEWLTISPEKPCSLKIGGLLKPTVGAYRQGRTVRIGWGLLDAGRREYSCRNAQAPRFAIYCDGQAVGSGSFEYG